MINGSIKEEDITIVNMYSPNIRVYKIIMQILTLLMGEIGSNTIYQGTLTPHFHQWTDLPDTVNL